MHKKQLNPQPRFRFGILGVLALGFFHPVLSQVESNYQSQARPMGLDIVDTVNIGGSDSESQDFQANVLPSLTDYLSTNLSERSVVTDSSSIALDPSHLILATDSDVRIYFVGEGAGYHNTLGFHALDAGDPELSSGIDQTRAALIFPDGTSSVSSLSPNNTARRSYSAPLLPGDFVDLGTYGAGTLLDFFLIANGAYGGRNVFASGTTRNPDSIYHMVSFVLPDSPYLMIGFEDLFGGGDRDYNDMVFAVDIGQVNLQKLVGAPEPKTWAIMISFALVLLLIERRVRASQNRAN